MAALRDLVDRGDARDGRERAFVDANLRFGWSRAGVGSERAELEAVHASVRAMARQSHAPIRAEIRSGALRGAALRKHFDAVPAFDRDHYVEEVLGIAYPPLDEPPPSPELIAYTPSGYDEIVHALDVTQLGPSDRFLDIGSGMGKAVLLAGLLCGATSMGIELHRALHDLADEAARELALETARFHHGDARGLALEDADVVFMYLPCTGTALATVMSRVLRGRLRFLCAGPLDPQRYPHLVAAGPPRSWLNVYRSR